jgi:DNA-binding CsgD family transcriptional regulator
MLYKVKDYEFLSIDVDGNCYSSYTLNKLTPYTDRDGYLRIKVWCPVEKKTKGCYVHRALAIVFIQNTDPTTLTQVNHKDSNRRNNSIENLEWVSPKGNYQHGIEFGNMLIGRLGYRATISDETVRQVCSLLCEGKKIMEICKITGLNKSTVYSIKSKQSWSHISNDYEFNLPRKYLTEDDVRKVLLMFISGKTTKEIIAEFGGKINRHHVANITSGKTHKELYNELVLCSTTIP